MLGLVQEARAQGQTVIFSGHVLPEVEQVADRVAIMRKGRLMHVEDMHARRRLRMLLIRFEPGEPPIPAPGAGADRARATTRADAPVRAPRRAGARCCDWLARVPIEDIAIGTEDLRSLYDQFHGPNVPDEE